MTASFSKGLMAPPTENRAKKSPHLVKRATNSQGNESVIFLCLIEGNSTLVISSAVRQADGKNNRLR